MSHEVEFVARSVIIGVGATVVMDLWGQFLKRFGVPPLNYAFLGRWIAHLPQGQLVQDNIARTNPVKGERLIGWCAHYSIGVFFAGLLLGLCGLSWARSPSWLPAIALGVRTVVAPYFILQPGLGLGIASSKTPTPNFNRLKSLATHTVYGVGLYLAAMLSAAILPA